MYWDEWLYHKSQLDRKEQETWRKQNNATGVFLQDMEQEGTKKNVKKTGQEEGWGGDQQIMC